MDSDIRDAIEALKDELATVYGDRLNQVILYGSHARGEGTEDSDIDIMVVLQDEVEPYKEISELADAVYRIELDHGVLFSLAPISKADYEHRRSPLLLNVRREGVPA